jgi:cytochrome oxidase Cu insertion factor (SCO1/SenC/PrrC family)
MLLRKVAVRVAAALVVAYVLLFATVAAAMLQTPDRFGMFMRYAPQTVVWGALPSTRMWLWARAGRLSHGEPAPDFTLPTQVGSSRVTLSSLRGRPVVLVFGSYT